MQQISHVDVWLTVQRSITLVDFQIDAQNSYLFIYNTFIKRGTRWRIWLRHCATSRKVANSIPDGVVGIFH